MATVQVDPSNQLGGLTKWVATLIAGWLTAKIFKGQFQVDPVEVAGILTGVGTLVWQILHRSKVGRAQAATAAASSITDPEQVSAIAKAA